MPVTHKPLASSRFDALPVPRDLESRDEFTTRFVTTPSARLRALTSFQRRQSADAAWRAAYLRSLVSVKTSGGEFLMFS